MVFELMNNNEDAKTKDTVDDNTVGCHLNDPLNTDELVDHQGDEKNDEKETRKKGKNPGTNDGEIFDSFTEKDGTLPL
jgi:hypothetical protein